MRVSTAAFWGCLVCGLALLPHPFGTRAAQIPFSISTQPQRATAPAAKWTLPRGSNNTAVVFDKYSLALGGGQQRLFVLAAEFHPWRLPVPSLWRDVLQKIRAAGFNTVSIYTHWGLIQPSPDAETIDLTGVNDLDFFLALAKEVGLFVIVRPGPYINAETTVGGMAPWTVKLDAVLRTNDTAWRKAWRPYIDAISRVVVKHQLVHDASRPDELHGGSVILVQADNEYKTGKAERAYMMELVAALKENGISVPITYNDPGREQNFVDLVDLYGLDSYPQRFDCSHPETWVPMRDDYLQYHMDTNPDQPFYIPEFQAGSYDPYAGPGYEACARMTNASFTRVANQALIAQRVTLLSLYMVYGGTNWGGLAEPDVYSSYDYGAALNEHRQPNDKYAELKRQAGFIAAFPDLAMTEQIADKPGLNISQVGDLDDEDASVDPATIRTTVLENPKTKSRFYVVRHNDTSVSRRTRFALHIVSQGKAEVIGARQEQEVEKRIGVNFLAGRDSHIIPVDQQLPGGLLMRWCTANVNLVTTIGDALLISLDWTPGQLVEYSLVTSEDDYVESMHLLRVSEAGIEEVQDGEWDTFVAMHSDIQANPRNIRARMASGEASDRFVVYRTAKAAWIIIMFSETALTSGLFSVPARYTSGGAGLSLHRPESSLVSRFFGHSEDSVVVMHVDMLRNATYASTDSPLDTLYLCGSLSRESHTALNALPDLKYVYWNGERIDAQADEVSRRFYRIHLPGPSRAAREWTPPRSDQLDWRWRDSMPEASAAFDDSSWVKANKTKSANPYTRDPSLDTQGVILFASEYGFHANNIVWRGCFATPSHTQDVPRDVNIRVEGGRSSAFSMWLNGVYLGSAAADREKSAAGATFSLPGDAFQASGDNVLAVLQDHMGIEMEAGELPIGFQEQRGLEAVKLPRGIVAFNFPSLRTASRPEPKVTWRVQGNMGGEQARDTVRRSLNEGGLHAEVQGWHLPGYDASTWNNTLTHQSGRVTMHRTTFELNVPQDSDVGVSFVFATIPEVELRAQLYVNGWQMGKFVNALGPQTVFPVHSGVLNHRGDNTLAVSVWMLGDAEQEMPTWDPRSHLKIDVAHRVSGEPRDGYVLDAPGWKQLRA